MLSLQEKRLHENFTNIHVLDKWRKKGIKMKNKRISKLVPNENILNYKNELKEIWGVNSKPKMK